VIHTLLAGSSSDWMLALEGCVCVCVFTNNMWKTQRKL
jgi:hypothetical protein